VKKKEKVKEYGRAWEGTVGENPDLREYT